MDSEARLTQHRAHMDSRKLALLCRELAENRKAEDVAVLDVRKLSSVTDYFVIATGTSEPHLRAIENELVGRLTEGVQARHGVAGAKSGSIDVLSQWMRAGGQQDNGDDTGGVFGRDGTVMGQLPPAGEF